MKELCENFFSNTRGTTFVLNFTKKFFRFFGAKTIIKNNHREEYILDI
jgi:hypothetical protein